MTNLLSIINLQDYKSILCLDGDLPGQEYFAYGLPIIAADGAANKLVAMGVEPSIIIGDLDAVDPALLKKIKSLHIPDQDSNDYQKCLQFMVDNALLPAIIYGVNGGHLDHILNNINIFMTGKNVLFSPPLLGFVLQENEQKVMTLPSNTKLSLIGIPTATISSHGLKWELDNYQLAFPGASSCFNRTVGNEISLIVRQGRSLALIYL